MGRKAISIFILSFLAIICSAQNATKLFQPLADSVQVYLRQFADVDNLAVTRVATRNGLQITFNNALSSYPFRDEQIDSVKAIIKANMPSKYALYKANFRVMSNGYSLDELKSNYYTSDRKSKPIEEHFQYSEQFHQQMTAPAVSNLSKDITITNGLQNRHIALWQGHGYYYNQEEMRWKWQRARFFETIEDLFTQSFVLPFLVPMLENAGAYVLLPRERDLNSNEVIVDNDNAATGYYEEGDWSNSENPGFANPKSIYYHGENPFKMGTARITDSDTLSRVYWIPDIPQAGEYAVYVSYQSYGNSCENVRYIVKHQGGITEYSVNQKVGGGTWMYLGTFSFEKGQDYSQCVILDNPECEEDCIVTADAVRFGGGMGNIARKPADYDEEGKPINRSFPVEPEISHKPRFAEASRYYLQWAGVADSVYSSKKNQNDYTDDVAARGLWVNSLIGGSYLDPDHQGYGIPVDLSFGLHTDAGVFLNDSIVGTMAIYTRNNNDGKTKNINGEDRAISRDYADMVQTQIVEDIRASFTKEWCRRELLDRSYAESRNPEVPSIMIELLSHQNFADMRYGNDPSFKFVVSRAIYKGMLKYLAYINNFQYVVQPLPVTSFKCEIGNSVDLEAHLSWSPSIDTLESTAVPDSYIVYQRINDGGWDNGTLVSSQDTSFAIKTGNIYSFKITAVNAGGESFPSEILSVGVVDRSAKTAMVINNFDRIAGPSNFATPDTTFAGFRDDVDGGVSYIRNISYVGPQIEFRRNFGWINDDNSGFGDSRNDYETKIIAGNTFDYPFIHGKAFMEAGYNFCSMSNESISNTDISKYHIVDVICGKQITTKIGQDDAAPLKFRVFTDDIQAVLTSYASGGGNIIVSGSNIANDIWGSIYQFDRDSAYIADVVAPSKRFVNKILKYDNVGHISVSQGLVRSVQNGLGIRLSEYEFNTEYNDRQYAVEMVDGITPVGKNAHTLYRYPQTGVSAGIAYLGNDYKSVSLGFPIESLTSQEQVNALIGEIVRLFAK